MLGTLVHVEFDAGGAVLVVTWNGYALGERNRAIGDNLDLNALHVELNAQLGFLGVLKTIDLADGRGTLGKIPREYTTLERTNASDS